MTRPVHPIDEQRCREIVREEMTFERPLQAATKIYEVSLGRKHMSGAEQELRLECLKLALSNFTGTAADVVGHAETFLAFAMGIKDSRSVIWGEEVGALLKALYPHLSAAAQEKTRELFPEVAA